MKLSTFPSVRQGSIAPLAAFSLIFIIGMVAFAVDVSWMVSTETELQNAADAGALAAIGQLPDYYVQYSLPNVTSSQKTTILTNAYAAARTAAQNCVSYNGAGGIVSLSLDTTNDVTFSYTTNGTTFTDPGSNFPNTVTVTVRRDGTNANTNGALNLFFAPVIGTKTASLKASATATMYGGTMDSLKGPAGVLPMTYDYKNWDNFLATGKDVDGTITLGSDGLPQLVVYPSVKDTGNFGLLSLDDSHVGDSTLRGWINDGMSQTDVDALKSANLIPLSSHNSSQWDWSGDNGFKASVVMDINDRNGQSFILPLFKAYHDSAPGVDYEAGTGNGSHYNYNIVRFVGVKVVSTGNRQVIVQPAAVMDADMLFTSLNPVVSGSGTVTTTFGTSKLTR